MAGPTVQCRDEMSDGEWLMEYKLPVEESATTVREFIRARVEHETGAAQRRARPRPPVPRPRHGAAGGDLRAQRLGGAQARGQGRRARGHARHRPRGLRDAATSSCCSTTSRPARSTPRSSSPTAASRCSASMVPLVVPQPDPGRKRSLRREVAQAGGSGRADSRRRARLVRSCSTLQLRTNPRLGDAASSTASATRRRCR